LTTCATCTHKGPAPDIRVAAAFKKIGLNRNQRRRYLPGTLAEMSLCAKDESRVVGPRSSACKDFEEKT
jgi:hypothetical protein